MKITLGEGNTPLLRLKNLEKLLNWQGSIWAKCEFCNPTGSFKDRGSVFEIREALQKKKKGIVCASTGNMAASLSAYAAKFNLKCIVVIPKKTPDGKLKQATICGAELIKIDGNYDNCVKKAIQIAKEKNLLLCGDYETRRIGQRTIGIEIAKSKIKFDAFICPVGNGTVGCAISEGFAKFNLYPKFIGVQGKDADPIFQAWKNKIKIQNISNPSTIASAMNVGSPLDGNLTIELVKRTNGEMVSVSDEEIISAQNLLAKTEGIFVEKASAATVAKLIRISSEQTQRPVPTIKNTENIVLILTGNGLKEGCEKI